MRCFLCIRVAACAEKYLLVPVLLQRLQRFLFLKKQYLKSADFICTETGGRPGPSLAQLGPNFAGLKEVQGGLGGWS
jgi:hypothetical protein